MYGLLPSARHCPIWQRSFDIETRGGRLDRRHFCFAVPDWVRPSIAEMLREKSPSSFLSDRETHVIWERREETADVDVLFFHCFNQRTTGRLQSNMMRFACDGIIL